MREPSIGEVINTQKRGVAGYDYIAEFQPGIHWFKYCLDLPALMFKWIETEPPWYQMGRRVHAHYNQFLIDDDSTLLFDTGAVTRTDEFIKLIKKTLEGDELDYLVISHPDVDHTGNTERVLREYPDVTVIAPGYGIGHDLYYLKDAVKVTEGDEINLGNHHLTFHDAPFIDSAVTAYMFEHSTRTFFPVDWFNTIHVNHECKKYMDEIDFVSERMIDFGMVQWFWLQWADLDKVKAEISHLIQKLSPERIAPSHGPVIRKDGTKFLEDWKTNIIDEIARLAAKEEDADYRIQAA